MNADDRLAKLESVVEEYSDRYERQHETIVAQQERIASLERELADEHDRSATVSRRGTLKAGGLAGLLALGASAGTATAAPDPTGRIGTEDRPIETLYAAGLDGPLTDGERLASLVGSGLTVAVDGLAVEPTITPPDDLDAVLDGMDQDEDGTYVITTVHELQAMNADRGADYRLDDDVDAVGTALWHGGKGFDPVGEVNDPFTGTFDGEGHVISGLTIDRGYRERVGLFGDSTGTIERVGLVRANVTGHAMVGGLVGSSGDTVSECYATGEVTGHRYVGGLIGFFDGNVTESYAIVSVSAFVFAGGFVGGGFDDVVESFAAGAVSAASDDGAGGFVGLGPVSGSATYWDVPASGQASSDGSTGLGDIGDEPPADEMTGDSLDAGFEDDFDFDATWETVSDADPDARRGDDYPVLRALDRRTQLESRG